jgi:S-adenosyl methyltransferase
VAQDAAVAYVDTDPGVGGQAEPRLLGPGNSGFARADVRVPEKFLAHPVIRELIDFDRPVGLVLSGVLHFVSDEEDPYRIITVLRDALAPGSYLVLSHCTADFRAQAGADAFYDGATRLTLRSAERIEPLFDGFELIAPGVVQLPFWRPDLPPPHTGTPERIACYGGVGRKP